jgi:hypothetical protein
MFFIYWINSKSKINKTPGFSNNFMGKFIICVLFMVNGVTITIFWDVTPNDPIEVHRRFRERTTSIFRSKSKQKSLVAT